MALVVAFNEVRPEKVGKLRSWMPELERRRDEVLETFKQETVSHEQAYLLEGKYAPILIYVIEVEDPEVGRKAFQESTLPIDLEHRRVMDEIVSGPAEVQLLYDVAL